MELIKLNQENLKVILSKDDMKKLNISANELDYSKTETKQIIWTILAQAKTIEDFNTDSSKIYVQIYPSRDGGCEMYIKKIGLIAEYDNEAKSKGKFKLISRSCTDDKLIVILEFDELLELCKRISNTKHCVASSLFVAVSGKYILKIASNEPHHCNIVSDLLNIIYEYGEVLSLDNQIEAYLNEHCKTVILNQAINKISSITQ